MQQNSFIAGTCPDDVEARSVRISMLTGKSGDDILIPAVAVAFDAEIPAVVISFLIP
jgi:hypothetical protein